MHKKQGIIISLICIIISLSGYCGYRFIRHEMRQEQQFTELNATISKLYAQVDSIKNEEIEWLDSGYNWLAIGNSITLHGICDYWWNEVGMAASDIGHDYYGIVLEHLKRHNKEVKGIPYNLSAWEIQNHDRDEILSCIKPYLNPKLDLITIQLGENVVDTTTYENDYVSLINFLKEYAPSARIIVIGDFWNDSNKEKIEKRVVNDTGIEFVSLEGIADNQSLYCGLGTIVYDSEGNAHTVEHGGVAKHPGDEGMNAIANRIMEVLK